jgi:hypothetical protein
MRNSTPANNAGAGVKLSPAVEAAGLPIPWPGALISCSVIQAPNAHAHLWSLTVDPRFGFDQLGGKPYVVGGVVLSPNGRADDSTVTEGLVFDPSSSCVFSVPFAAEQVRRNPTQRNRRQPRRWIQ